WWNLYRRKLDAATNEAILPMHAEFGQPQWVFGMSTYAFAGPNRIVCSYVSQGLGCLGILDLESRVLTPMDLPFTDYASVRAVGNRVAFRGGSSVVPLSIVSMDLTSGRTQTLKQSTDVANDPGIARYFTRVEPVEFAT